jgi:hypothetical protein
VTLNARAPLAEEHVARGGELQSLYRNILK